MYLAKKTVNGNSAIRIHQIRRDTRYFDTAIELLLHFQDSGGKCYNIIRTAELL